jgi:hypothetical protein
MRTMMSPVNWTYSIHNFFADRGGPSWLRELFGLDSPLTLAGFSVLDLALTAIGRGALLRAKLRKPAGDRRGHRRPEYGEGDHPA